MRVGRWLSAVLALALLAGGCEKKQGQQADAGLCWAARQGDVQKVQSLITGGVPVNVTEHNGRTPLHNAAEYGHIEIVRLLVRSGAHIDALDHAGHTPAMFAMGKDHRAVVELLLSEGASVNLRLAAYLGDTVRAASLIESGADVDAKNPYGRTALHYAALYNRQEIARLLIAAGADINIGAGHNDGTKHDTGETPLHHAVMAGHLDLAVLLIDSGADMNVKARYGITPLYWAAREGKSEAIELLVARGADANVKAESDNSLDGTPLGAAIQTYRADIVKMLVAGGADPNARDESGWTPLHMAAMNYGSLPEHEVLILRIVELLVARGADVNAADEEGITPLHCAVYQSHRRVIECLLAKGADVDAGTVLDPEPDERVDLAEFGFRTARGVTPLHEAVVGRDPHVIATLLEHGARVDANDGAGNTPLHYAAVWSGTEAAKLLIAAGADVNAANNDGATPLVIALRNGEVETARVLLAAGAHKVVVTLPSTRMRMELVLEPESLLHAAIRAHVRPRPGGHISRFDPNRTLNRRDWIDLLLENGADPNERDEEGNTPLHSAASYGHKDVVEGLLAHGVDPNARNSRGRTPLDEAARRGHEDVVRLLRTELAVKQEDPRESER